MDALQIDTIKFPLLNIFQGRLHLNIMNNILYFRKFSDFSCYSFNSQGLE